jgi:MYXO-CTERM domain-containing protein
VAVGLIAMTAIALLWARPVDARPWRAERAHADGAVADAVVAEREARRYLSSHLPSGALMADFVVVANQLDGDLRTVSFQQTWRGLRVVDATVAFVFGRSDDGDRLFAVKSRALANIDAPIVSRRRVPTGELVVLRRGGTTTIAEQIEEKAPDTPQRWRVYLDANDEALEREELVMDATATLKFNAGIRYARGARQDYEAVKNTITVNGSASATSATGVVTWVGTSPATIVPSVVGAYVKVHNSAGADATTTFASVQGGSTITWDLSADELGDAQVSTYVYANRAKDRARIVNPSAATWLDMPLDFYVNAVGECNAYSTGNEVYLYRSSEKCENTGRIADIVFHEFAHSLHKHSIIMGVGAFESSLSEGLSDFFAANMTEDPAVGRGLYLADDSPLRNIDPVGVERVYPADVDFDDHITGLIVAGALWDLRKGLVSSLGFTAGVAQTEKIFTGVMQRADDITTTFDAALIADDDNADLSDGTPNFCAIENAFGRHGLVDGFQTTTVSLPIVDGMHVTLNTSTPAGSACAPPAITHAYVTWKAGDGVASTFELTNAGETWSGDIPEQPTGTIVSYSLDVQFSDGTSQVFPNNPADPLYQLMAGVPSQIWCERMDIDPMWTQSSNAGVEWQWAAPVQNPASGDPNSAKTGGGVLGTDITGDGRYRQNLATSIQTPVIDVSRYQHVHLQYWRWLTVEDSRYDQATIFANDEPIWHNVFSPTGTLDHVDREWRFHDLDVTQLVRDGGMQIKWALTTDFNKELGGWTIDDVCLVGLDRIGECGDSIVEEGEQCDDGGLEDGDGCSHQCILEPFAGGGGGCDCSTGGGSYGWLVAVMSVLVPWRRRSRRLPSRSVSERMP